jgi:uncharacterized protein (DUF1697 family)
MKQYISLLRGINVSGQKKISMAELARCYDACGFETVRTYIQSGNVLFKSAKPASQCREEIERGIREAFGFDVLVRVLDLPELKAIRSALPFGGERVFFTFIMANGPSAGAAPDLSELMDHRAEGDQLAAVPGAIYFLCPGSYGRSKLSNNFIERKLGIRASTRNLKTVDALIGLCDDDPE